MINDMFTLEAVNAKFGDALLLHYGTANDCRTLLIDGGPAGVYKTSMKPRLEQIAQALDQRPFAVEHVFVTHLDSDHIRGILDLTRDTDPPITCTSYWFNTFPDARLQLPDDTKAALKTHGVVQLASVAAVTASVPEGQELRDRAREEHFTVNGGSGKLLMANDVGVQLDVDPDFLTVTLVAPNRMALQKLADAWKKKAKPTQAETSEYLDQSVYNLSSLVMVVEATAKKGSRRMLLTGDARGDHTLDGLEAADFLKNGKAHFDLLKIGHHGSDRNYAEDFFQRITADHYVISADGKYDNPSEEVLVWIGKNAPKDYQLWLTNTDGTGYDMLPANIKAAEKRVPGLSQHIATRSDGHYALSVNLLDKPGF